MIRKILKNKKAWIRILEAFIAIVLIMSAAIITLSNQKKQTDRPEEITKLLSSILDVISRDDSIRSEILSNTTTSVNLTIEKIIPSWLAYSSRICDYGDICSNPAGYLDKSVYTDEILVAANLTYKAPYPVKLKVFLWEK